MSHIKNVRNLIVYFCFVLFTANAVQAAEDSIKISADSIKMDEETYTLLDSGKANLMSDGTTHFVLVPNFDLKVPNTLEDNTFSRRVKVASIYAGLIISALIANKLFILGDSPEESQIAELKSASQVPDRIDSRIDPTIYDTAAKEAEKELNQLTEEKQEYDRIWNLSAGATITAVLGGTLHVSILKDNLTKKIIAHAAKEQSTRVPAIWIAGKDYKKILRELAKVNFTPQSLESVEVVE